MYTERVMDHFQNPRNVGELQNPSGVGTVGNAKCGDIMQMFIKVNDAEVIEGLHIVRFDGDLRTNSLRHALSIVGVRDTEYCGGLYSGAGVVVATGRVDRGSFCGYLSRACLFQPYGAL